MCICGVFHLFDHSLNYQNMCVYIYKYVYDQCTNYKETKKN